MSIIDSRYEISCSYCGVVGFERRFHDAVSIVRSAVHRHNQCEDIMIMDLMAHFGKPELFNVDGSVRSNRT